MLVHLLPEELACALSVSVIEAVKVTLADPVADAVLVCLVVHPSLIIELLIVFGINIELRPNGDHHTSSEIMD